MYEQVNTKTLTDSFGNYLDTISKYPIPRDPNNPEEDLRLKEEERQRFFDLRILEDQQTKTDDIDKKKELAEKIFSIKEVIFKGHLLSAVQVAKAHNFVRRYNLEDLVSEANIELWTAIDRYDPNDGRATFDTYARVCMDYALISFKNRGTYDDIVMPAALNSATNKYYQVKSQMPDFYTQEELAEATKNAGLNLDPSEYERMMSLRQFQRYDAGYSPKYGVSKSHAAKVFGSGAVQTSLGSTDDVGFGEFSSDDFLDSNIETDEEVFKSVFDAQAKREIEAMLTKIPVILEETVRLRYGIGSRDGEERTLEEVGNYYGVGKEAIRKRLLDALKKLREPSRSSRVKGFLDSWPSYRYDLVRSTKSSPVVETANILADPLDLNQLTEIILIYFRSEGIFEELINSGRGKIDGFHKERMDRFLENLPNNVKEKIIDKDAEITETVDKIAYSSSVEPTEELKNFRTILKLDNNPETIKLYRTLVVAMIASKNKPELTATINSFILAFIQSQKTHRQSN